MSRLLQSKIFAIVLAAVAISPPASDVFVLQGGVWKALSAQETAA